ncbi:hypothetical protein ACFE04_026901 [Oxalis oulophora]
MVEEESNESILELNVPFEENIGLNEISTDDNQSTDVNQQIPFVGMMFDSEDELYAFYKKYSFEVGFGFGVRKFGCKNGKREGVKYYSLACAKGGKYVPKLDSVKTRLSIKTKCEAKICVIVRSNGKCEISRVTLEHNHTLSPKKSHI